MPKPGNRSANRLVIRFVTARLKAASQRLRKRIRRMGVSRIARSRLTAAVIGMSNLPNLQNGCRYPAQLAALIHRTVYATLPAAPGTEIDLLQAATPDNRVITASRTAL